ncbi:MAG: hypothetical protein GXO48_03975 [Chlorobi bacterium]|nr:hypothetical protein [Chlorobiota bacterium]
MKHIVKILATIVLLAFIPSYAEYITYLYPPLAYPYTGRERYIGVILGQPTIPYMGYKSAGIGVVVGSGRQGKVGRIQGHLFMMFSRYKSSYERINAFSMPHVGWSLELTPRISNNVLLRFGLGFRLGLDFVSIKSEYPVKPAPFYFSTPINLLIGSQITLNSDVILSFRQDLSLYYLFSGILYKTWNKFHLFDEGGGTAIVIKAKDHFSLYFGTQPFILKHGIINWMIGFTYTFSHPEG